MDDHETVTRRSRLLYVLVARTSQDADKARDVITVGGSRHTVKLG
jgi:hypothetical protein